MSPVQRMTNAREPRGGWPKLQEFLDRAERMSAPAPTPAAPVPSRMPTLSLDRSKDPPSSPFIAGSGLWQPLGTVGRRQFGTVSGMPDFEGREFELEESDRPVIDLDAGGYFLAYPETEPWRVRTDANGQEVVEYADKFRRLVPWPTGTFEKLTKPQPAARVRDSRPIDGLTGHPFIGKRAPTRQTILTLLGREGITLARGLTGEMLVSSQGGRWPKDWVADLLRKPGMADYLLTELPCAWPHDAGAPLAQTLGFMGEGICSPAAHRVKPATSVVGKAKAALGFGASA